MEAALFSTPLRDNVRQLNAVYTAYKEASGAFEAHFMDLYRDVTKKGVGIPENDIFTKCSRLLQRYAAQLAAHVVPLPSQDDARKEILAPMQGGLPDELLLKILKQPCLAGKDAWQNLPAVCSLWADLASQYQTTLQVVESNPAKGSACAKLAKFLSSPRVVTNLECLELTAPCTTYDEDWEAEWDHYGLQQHMERLACLEPLGACHKLRSLKLQYALRLDQLPNSLARLTNLEELQLRGVLYRKAFNPLVNYSASECLKQRHRSRLQLDTFLCRLPKLKRLDLQSNFAPGERPLDLTHCFTRMRALEHLTLGTTRASTASLSGIAQLPRLHTLSFAVADTDGGLPAQLADLSRLGSLRELRCVVSMRDGDPGACVRLGFLSGLSSLRRLVLGTPHPVSMQDLRNLAQLTSLDMRSEWMGAGPSLQHLTGLDSLLDLRLIDAKGSRQMVSLSPAVAELTRLRVLHVRGTGLKEIPDGITKLKNLECLVLSGNALTSLPDDIGALSRLVELDVADNELMALPQGITHLTRLQSLLAPRNALTGLPPGFARLASRLHHLNVQGNALKHCTHFL